MKESLETFSPWGGEPCNVSTPLGKIPGLSSGNEIKGSVIPLPHVDFIEPLVNDNGLARADNFCSAAAAVQAGAEDLAEWDLGQGFGPDLCLVLSFGIQGNVCVADEPFFSVCFNLSVAEQENQGTGAGILEKWGCR